MSDGTLLSKLTLRNSVAADWITHSTKVLLKGEIGLSFSETTGLVEEFKIGDGISIWAELQSEAFLLQGSSIPTTSTKGALGQIYIVNDAGNVTLYQCTAIAGSVYTWTENGRTSYDLSAESSTGGADIKLTGSDSSEDAVNIRGSGATVVSKDATGIKISSTDNDTKIANLTKDSGKVVTGAASGTTLQTTSVEDLQLEGYSKSGDTGAIAAEDSLNEAFSKLEN